MYTGIAERALTLLGNGVHAEAVASALGVDASYISQLLSEEEFSAKVAELKYAALQKHNERDSNYDKIEDSLLSQLESSIPLLHRPLEITRVLQVINSAKRRGTSSPDAITTKTQQAVLVLPTQLVQKFTTNINNQVIQVSGQNLVTIDPKSLLEKVGTQNDTKQLTEKSGS